MFRVKVVLQHLLRGFKAAYGVPHEVFMWLFLDVHNVYGCELNA